MSEFARHAPDHLLTLEEVAVMARVDAQVVTDAIRDRKLVARQQRGSWFATVADVRRWLSRR
jgi:hypothetical protein